MWLLAAQWTQFLPLKVLQFIEIEWYCYQKHKKRFINFPCSEHFTIMTLCVCVCRCVCVCMYLCTCVYTCREAFYFILFKLHQKRRHFQIHTLIRKHQDQFYLLYSFRANDRKHPREELNYTFRMEELPVPPVGQSESTTSCKRSSATVWGQAMWWAPQVCTEERSVPHCRVLEQYAYKRFWMLLPSTTKQNLFRTIVILLTHSSLFQVGGMALVNNGMKIEARPVDLQGERNKNACKPRLTFIQRGYL